MKQTSCKIVVKDWLEDCLAPVNPSKKLCRVEKQYLLPIVLERINKANESKALHIKNFGDSFGVAHELTTNREFDWPWYQMPLKNFPKYLGEHHVYVDSTGFEYKAVCTRINTEGKVKSERYTIYVCSSSHLPQKSNKELTSFH